MEGNAKLGIMRNATSGGATCLSVVGAAAHGALPAKMVWADLWSEVMMCKAVCRQGRGSSFE